MRSGIRLCLLPLVFVLLLVAPAIAQGIRFYPDFSSPVALHQLSLNGSSRLTGYGSQVVLRLTDGNQYPAETSTAYFDLPQRVDLGFTTWFKFKIHNPTACCNPGDGFAFIIQNSNATDPTQGASGSGLTAVGAGGGGLGYSGINNSLAIEFDIFDDPWDPNSNHVAIQSCGGNYSLFNSPVHLPGVYTIGQNNDVTSCLLNPTAFNTTIPTLGGTCNGSSCTDGTDHQVVIQYTPGVQNQPGMLQVWLDPTFIPDTQTPIPGAPTVLNVPYNIVYNTQNNPKGLQLTSDNKLWAGFTAAQPSSGGKRGGGGASGGTAIDVSAWEFTTFSQSQITQLIPAGGVENDYVFGAHQMGVTFPTDFQNNNNIFMTVEQTPVNQTMFYDQRLLGTDFANENCIIYLGTGGNCVLYTVTCQDSLGNMVPCPTEPDKSIALCTKFTTPEPISVDNPDFLRAEPIGSNNWCSVFNGFSPNNDPVVSGKGTGFSDIVATLIFSGQGGPQCQTDGSLKALTEKMESKIPAPPGSGFCPPIR
ncbi:MAG: L-type lectin-domain containing protein [Candidatus Korobacteraceae bacterium]